MMVEIDEKRNGWGVVVRGEGTEICGVGVCDVEIPLSPPLIKGGGMKCLNLD